MARILIFDSHANEDSAGNPIDHDTWTEAYRTRERPRSSPVRIFDARGLIRNIPLEFQMQHSIVIPGGDQQRFYVQWHAEYHGDGPELGVKPSKDNKRSAPELVGLSPANFDDPLPVSATPSAKKKLDPVPWCVETRLVDDIITYDGSALTISDRESRLILSRVVPIDRRIYFPASDEESKDATSDSESPAWYRNTRDNSEKVLVDSQFVTLKNPGALWMRLGVGMTNALWMSRTGASQPVLNGDINKVRLRIFAHMPNYGNEDYFASLTKPYGYNLETGALSS